MVVHVMPSFRRHRHTVSLSQRKKKGTKQNPTNNNKETVSKTEMDCPCHGKCLKS